MKTSQKKMVFAPLKGLAAVILAVIQVYPIFYVFLSSLKTQEDFRKLPSYAFPSSFQLANYKRVLEVSPIVTYFKNSIIILVFTLAVLLVISSMAGFALAKIKFKRNQFMLNYFMLGLMLPCQVALIPLFTIFSKMGLLNTYAAIILPQVAFALSYSIQLFYSFSKFMPNEIIEAAIIDGCSPLQSYVRIVCPMSTNSLLTVGSMLGYLELHYKNDISLDELADEFHVSKNYVTRLLKRYTGKSFSENVLRIRMNKAVELITSTDYSISRVGDLVGYHDTSYFIQVFKKQMGVTPNDYKRLY